MIRERDIDDTCRVCQRRFVVSVLSIRGTVEVSSLRCRPGLTVLEMRTYFCEYTVISASSVTYSLPGTVVIVVIIIINTFIMRPLLIIRTKNIVAQYIQQRTEAPNTPLYWWTGGIFHLHLVCTAASNILMNHLLASQVTLSAGRDMNTFE